MTEFKGTKNPWKVVESTCGLVVETQCITIRVGQDDIVTVWGFDQESQANARLISKSPEMLQMLERTVEFFDEGGSTYSTVAKFLSEIKELIKDATTL